MLRTLLDHAMKRFEAIEEISPVSQSLRNTTSVENRHVSKKSRKKAARRSTTNSLSQNLEMEEISKLLFASFSFGLSRRTAGHHNRRWRLIGARRNVDFLPCRSNCEIERKERSRERRRAIYDEGSNVESGEKGEILNDREQMSNCAGEGKGRSNRSEKFEKRENEPKGRLSDEKERRGHVSLFISQEERPRFASSTISTGE